MLGDHAKRDQIVRICGHNVFDNRGMVGADFDQYADFRLRWAIELYVACFNLEGVTAEAGFR